MSISGRTHEFISNLCDASTSNRGQFDNFVILKKQINVNISCVCLVTDNEFRHSIVKVVSFFNNIMTRIMVNNSTEAWKTDVNLLYVPDGSAEWTANEPNQLQEKIKILIFSWTKTMKILTMMRNFKVSQKQRTWVVSFC